MLTDHMGNFLNRLMEQYFSTITYEYIASICEKEEIQS